MNDKNKEKIYDSLKTLGLLHLLPQAQTVSAASAPQPLLPITSNAQTELSIENESNEIQPLVCDNTLPPITDDETALLLHLANVESSFSNNDSQFTYTSSSTQNPLFNNGAPVEAHESDTEYLSQVYMQEINLHPISPQPSSWEEFVVDEISVTNQNTSSNTPLTTEVSADGLDELDKLMNEPQTYIQQFRQSALEQIKWKFVSNAGDIQKIEQAIFDLRQNIITNAIKGTKAVTHYVWQIYIGNNKQYILSDDEILKNFILMIEDNAKNNCAKLSYAVKFFYENSYRLQVILSELSVEQLGYIFYKISLLSGKNKAGDKEWLGKLKDDILDVNICLNIIDRNIQVAHHSKDKNISFLHYCIILDPENAESYGQLIHNFDKKLFKNIKPIYNGPSLALPKRQTLYVESDYEHFNKLVQYPQEYIRDFRNHALHEMNWQFQNNGLDIIPIQQSIFELRGKILSGDITSKQIMAHPFWNIFIGNTSQPALTNFEILKNFIILIQDNTKMRSAKFSEAVQNFYENSLNLQMILSQLNAEQLGYIYFKIFSYRRSKKLHTLAWVSALTNNILDVNIFLNVIERNIQMSNHNKDAVKFLLQYCIMLDSSNAEIYDRLIQHFDKDLFKTIKPTYQGPPFLITEQTMPGVALNEEEPTESLSLEGVTQTVTQSTFNQEENIVGSTFTPIFNEDDVDEIYRMIDPSLKKGDHRVNFVFIKQAASIKKIFISPLIWQDKTFKDEDLEQNLLKFRQTILDKLIDGNELLSHPLFKIFAGIESPVLSYLDILKNFMLLLHHHEKYKVAIQFFYDNSQLLEDILIQLDLYPLVYIFSKLFSMFALTTESANRKWLERLLNRVIDIRILLGVLDNHQNVKAYITTFNDKIPWILAYCEKTDKAKLAEYHLLPSNESYLTLTPSYPFSPMLAVREPIEPNVLSPHAYTALNEGRINEAIKPFVNNPVDEIIPEVVPECEPSSIFTQEENNLLALLVNNIRGQKLHLRESALSQMKWITPINELAETTNLIFDLRKKILSGESSSTITSHPAWRIYIGALEQPLLSDFEILKNFILLIEYDNKHQRAAKEFCFSQGLQRILPQLSADHLSYIYYRLIVIGPKSIVNVDSNWLGHAIACILNVNILLDIIKRIVLNKNYSFDRVNWLLNRCIVIDPVNADKYNQLIQSFDITLFKTIKSNYSGPHLLSTPTTEPNENETISVENSTIKHIQTNYGISLNSVQPRNTGFEPFQPNKSNYRAKEAIALRLAQEKMQQFPVSDFLTQYENKNLSQTSESQPIEEHPSKRKHDDMTNIDNTSTQFNAYSPVETAKRPIISQLQETLKIPLVPVTPKKKGFEVYQPSSSRRRAVDGATKQLVQQQLLKFPVDAFLKQYDQKISQPQNSFSPPINSINSTIPYDNSNSVNQWKRQEPVNNQKNPNNNQQNNSIRSPMPGGES